MSILKQIKHLLFILLIGLCSCESSTTPTEVYTVVVSLDGFRWDYPTLYHTPYLDQMAKQGVSAVVYPSYPSSTFPNHYTMATGLHPNQHGIVNNTFWDNKLNKRYAINNQETRYDPYFYLGEPIWITAQKQGLRTANLYWVGSDVAIKNAYPTHYKKWDDKPRLTFEERIDQAISWLSLPKETRPQLIMLYLEEPDGIGHRYGPQSKETEQEVKRVDKLIGYLMNRITTLPHKDEINLIVTSDHGMTEISKDRVVSISDNIDTEWCEQIIGDNPTSLFTKPQHREEVYSALKKSPHLTVWKKEDIPHELSYGSSYRIGDIVVSPDLGWQFTDRPRNQKGAHGYLPTEKDMQVIFRAYGPSFKENYIHTNFHNVDLYSLLTRLLQITAVQTDGKVERIEGLLCE